MTFKHTHNQLYGAGQPYSTLLLERIRSSAEWVRQNRGSHTTLTLRGYNASETQQAYERPFVSVATDAVLLAVPWYTHRQLDQIHARIYCRISNGLLDASYADDADLPRNQVRLFSELWGASGTRASVLQAPFRDTPGGAPQWGWVSLSYAVGDISAIAGTYAGRFVIGFRSRPPWDIGSAYDGTTSQGAGRVSAAGFDSGVARSKHRVKADADGFYAEGATASAPASGANEITATALVHRDSLSSDTTNKVRGWVDHFKRQGLTSNRAMYIWPHTELLTIDPDDDGSVNHLQKWHVPYLQVRAIELWETYR